MPSKPRSNLLRPLAALLVLGVVPVVMACNGHVSLGDTGDALKQISSSDAIAKASATVGTGALSCQAGWAHPNICCSAGPDVASQCGAWEQNPFRACQSGSTTYPNMLSCCNLKTSQCEDSVPSGTSVPPTPPPTYGCGFACPPGWWTENVGSASGSSSSGGGSVTGYEQALCCTESGGETQCVEQGGGIEPVATVCATSGYGGSSGSSSGSSTGGVTGIADAGIPLPPPDASFALDAGPAPTEDAGTLPGGWFDDAGYYNDDGGYYGEDAGYYGCEDAGSSYPSGYDGGIASLCGVCPSGWSQTDPEQPELCCQTVSVGLTQCFSQASGSATSIGGVSGDDAGVVDPGEPIATGGSSSGGSSSPGTTSWGSAPANNADGAVGGPTCSGSSASCSCDETLGAHTYALDCYAGSSGSITCSCTIDGAPSPFGGVEPTSCMNSDVVQGLFSETGGCGFPQ